MSEHDTGGRNAVTAGLLALAALWAMLVTFELPLATGKTVEPVRQWTQVRSNRELRTHHPVRDRATMLWWNKHEHSA